MTPYDAETAYPWPVWPVTVHPPKGAPVALAATLYAEPTRPTIETRWSTEKLDADPETTTHARVQTVTGPTADGRADRIVVAPLILNGIPHSIDHKYDLRSTSPVVWAEDRQSAAYAMRRVTVAGEYIIGDAAYPTDKARAFLWNTLTDPIRAELARVPLDVLAAVEEARRNRYAAAANFDADRLAAMAGELRRRAGRLAAVR